MSLPFNSNSPSVGLSKPAIIRSVVVLPQPEGPKKVTNSPLFIVRLKSSTTRKPSSNVRLMFLNSMMFSPDVVCSNPVPPSLFFVFYVIFPLYAMKAAAFAAAFFVFLFARLIQMTWNAVHHDWRHIPLYERSHIRDKVLRHVVSLAV